MKTLAILVVSFSTIALAAPVKGGKGGKGNLLRPATRLVNTTQHLLDDARQLLTFTDRTYQQRQAMQSIRQFKRAAVRFQQVLKVRKGIKKLGIGGLGGHFGGHGNPLISRAYHNLEYAAGNARHNFRGLFAFNRRFDSQFGVGFRSSCPAAPRPGAIGRPHMRQVLQDAMQLVRRIGTRIY